MAQDQTSKEALFNEVKGSLFEYLIAKKIAALKSEEMAFHQSIDKNYLNVLSQQDRMVRQFYPEMLPFLSEVSNQTAEEIVRFFGEVPGSPKLMGKFINSSLQSDLAEADLIVQSSRGLVPISIKLNKKNSFVNTKSAGIKSFFQQYFSFLPAHYQSDFNQFVDLEFSRMAVELHSSVDLEYPGNFSDWVKQGLSELPGELGESERAILKEYYARIAKKMYEILTDAQQQNAALFAQSLAPLMGFGKSDILQVICFHDFKQSYQATIDIHTLDDVSSFFSEVKILTPNSTASVEVQMGNWILQIRVKPMNKFTTTAIKINCSIKVKQSSDA
jgi:hypothetical protein